MAPYLSNFAPMIGGEGCTSPLTLNMPTPSQPSLTYHSNPNMQDEQAQLEVLALPGIPTVDNEQHISSSMLDVTPTLTTQISSNHQLSDSVFDSDRPQIFKDHFNEAFAPHNCTLADPFTSTLAPNIHSNSKVTPMAQLIQRYSSALIESQLGSTKTSMMSVLSLEELTLDLIVDRGEVRARNLPRYYLAKDTMDGVCMVVTAQQDFLQQAAGLIVDRKSYFKVDPGNTLIPILQGTSSLPQLYTVWRALITRVKLGVKAWEKYIAEYQLQVGASALSSLSASHC